MQVGAPAASLELRDTPFFAQTEHHCGPAALATMLGASGIAATPEQLAPLIYLPGREGSLQAELLAAARRYQRLPLPLGRDPKTLFDALAAGYPVLVLQNLALPSLPAWHYAVLVGYEADTQRVVLRSGTEARERLSLQRFLDTWDRGGRWALVLAPASELPAFVSIETWLAAAAPFESLGQIELAHAAYQTALRREPESALAWQALASTRYARGEPAGAEQALRESLRLDTGSAAARNNLASLLQERGCHAQARRELAAITQVPPALESAVQQTRDEVLASADADGPGCESEP